MVFSGMITYALSCHLIIKNSDEKDQEKLGELLGENQRRCDEIVDHGLIGAPATIARKLQGYEEAGVNYVLLKPARTLEGLEAFGEKVLPQLGK